LIKKPVRYAILFLIGLGLVTSCSTEKNTSLTRNYHNLTSHYNIYFNASESFKEGLKKIDKGFEDNYSIVLPVFKYGDDNLASAVAPQMDRAINKATKIIKYHSITVKPEMKKEPETKEEKEFYNKNEYNKWVDDSYLLIGKANLYKHVYDKAKQAFAYVMKEFPDEPAYYEADIWLARTNIQTGDFEDAGTILMQLSSDMAFPADLSQELNTTWADYYIKQNQYDKAIEKLNKALPETRKKDNKIRFTYILAQLYDRTGQVREAAEHYAGVIKMNPPYEMIFNARINRAAAFKKGEDDPEEIMADLKKMLKDDKNIEYQDQIYFAMGNIQFRMGNTQQAIQYYSKSAAVSQQNTQQKAISYLSIADIYYAVPEYSRAQAYYDSAITLLDNKYKGYEEIAAKAEYLTNLITNLNTVKLQDSLQRLAAMDEAERNTAIDQIIANVRKEQQQQQEAERNRMMQQNFGSYSTTSSNAGQTGTEAGKWYFYNMQAKAMGEAEFKRKWGNRKLEDNWRRQNKKVITFDEMAQNPLTSENGGAAAEKDTLSNMSREYYLRDIPFSDSMLQTSDQKIREGLYNAGLIYRNELSEPELAAKTFKDLVNRYDNSDYELLALYQLYTLYKKEGNTAGEANYANQIISKYPESVYAKLLKNPDYIKELQAEENKVENFYQQTFQAYQNNQFADVIANANYALQNYKDDPLIPKFMLIKALAIGQTQQATALRASLDELIQKFPDSEEAAQAKNIIASINKVHPEVKEAAEAAKARQLFAYSNKVMYYVAIVVNSKEGDANQLVFNLINYNLDNYPKKEYNVNSELLDDGYSIVTVKMFKKEADAMDYYHSLLGNQDIMHDVNTDDYKEFIISPVNYDILIKNDALDEYMQFFSDNYLK